jgi:hypothetical protein
LLRKERLLLRREGELLHARRGGGRRINSRSTGQADVLREKGVLLHGKPFLLHAGRGSGRRVDCRGTRQTDVLREGGVLLRREGEMLHGGLAGQGGWLKDAASLRVGHPTP